MKYFNLKARRGYPTWQAFGIFAAIAVSLSGCGKSADEYIAQAQTQLAAGKIPAAIIELKNALQKDTKNLKARIMLGQAYLDVYDAADAETDLLRARGDGADAITLAKPLAEAELALGKFDQAVKESDIAVTGVTPALRASLASVRGLAYVAQGKIAQADQTFAAGLADDPQSVDVLAALTRYAVARRDLPAARDYIAKALAVAPSSPRLVTLKGAVAFAGGKFADADAAFAEVIKRQPWNAGVRTDLAEALIAEGKLKEADASLAPVLRGSPKGPRPNYLRALTAFQEKDYKAAQNYIQITLGTAPENLPALLLGGAIAYALAQYEQADSYLAKYVAHVPGDVRGRRLLAAVEIKLGRPGDAVKTLAPALGGPGGDDAQLLALIGEAAARSGDPADADKYLTRALEQQPNDVGMLTELGFFKIALGQVDAAIEEFEKANKQDPNATGPELALVTTFIKNKDYDKSLEAALRFQHQQPTNPLGYDLAGLTYVAKGDRQAARDAFEKARKITADDSLALLNLASLEAQDKNYDAAMSDMDVLRKANPNDSNLAIAVAQIQLTAGNAAAAAATLQAAIDKDPNNMALPVARARLLLAQHKATDAIASLDQAHAKNPLQPEVLEVLGQAQVTAGQGEAAVTTLQALVNVAPQSSTAHRELSGAYLAVRSQDKALAEARLAAQLAPTDRGLAVGLGSLLIQTEHLDEARQWIDDWVRKAPDDANFVELQGILASMQHRNDDALQAFQRGVALQDTGVTRTRLASALQQAGRTAEAEKTFTQWLDANPNDLVTRTALAQFYLTINATAKARDQYAEILRQAPNDAGIENNLAWTMSLLGQKEDALAHARHAAATAHEAPQVLDTLGVVLMQNGLGGEALDVLEKAAKGAPDTPDIQFHLTQALVQAGQNDRAREILRDLISTQKPFGERDEAQQLLNKLRG